MALERRNTQVHVSLNNDDNDGGGGDDNDDDNRYSHYELYGGRIHTSIQPSILV